MPQDWKTILKSIAVRLGSLLAVGYLVFRLHASLPIILLGGVVSLLGLMMFKTRNE